MYDKGNTQVISLPSLVRRGGETYISFINVSKMRSRRLTFDRSTRFACKKRNIYDISLPPGSQSPGLQACARRHAPDECAVARGSLPSSEVAKFSWLVILVPPLYRRKCSHLSQSEHPNHSVSRMRPQPWLPCCKEKVCHRIQGRRKSQVQTWHRKPARNRYRQKLRSASWQTDMTMIVIGACHTRLSILLKRIAIIITTKDNIWWRM